MPDPITPTITDPQASVDAALGTLPTPAVAPTPPEPPVATPPITPTVPMGDDTPLAFAAPTLNAMPTPPTTPVTPDAPKMEPMPTVGSSYLPPVPPAPASTITSSDNKPKKKSKIMLVVLGIFGLMGVLGVGGYYAYQRQGAEKPIDVAAITEESKCNGCSRPQDGGWLVWRNGECKVTGICNSSAGNQDPVTGESDKDTTPPQEQQAENASNASACTTAKGVWCDYGFCIPITSTKGCNQVAIEKGYVVNIGAVKCKSNAAGNGWVPDGEYRSGTNVDANGKALDDASIGAIKDPLDNTKYISVSEQVRRQCETQYSAGVGGGQIGFGDAKYICKMGVMGGSEVYTGGACTALNGKLFTGNLACFCGTVQIDQGSSHTSYTSTCGCNQQVVESPNPSPSPSPSPNAPVLACTGLTRTPTTESPAIGTVLTFTCAGTITPPSAGTLSYKFKYSLNSGADQLLANTTTTTARLTVDACGTYSVQCKVCATIGGVLKCDPTWTGAIQ